MKQVLAVLLASGTMAITASCNNRKPGDVTVTSDNGTKTTVNVNEMAQAATKANDKSAELAKLKPYTTDEIKALFPEELNGAKRTSYSANTAIGAVMANAEYKINDTSSYELTVIDCAGEAGAGAYGMQYMTMMNAETESETEYSKTIDFQGGRAYESLQKTDNDGSLIWMAKERLMVTLKGTHTGLEPVKQIAGSLKF